MVIKGRKYLNNMDENNINDKKILRRKMKKQREGMSREEMFSKSEQIFEQLITVPEYKRSDKIYTYVSMNNEVDTIMLIDYSLSIDKRVFVPKVIGNHMEFYEISDISELSSGYFGIYEPDINGKEPDYSRTGFMCMPGLAFDLSFNRLGYGRGFYDRYLAQENRLYKAALAYSCQLVPAVFAEPTDVKTDMIITESNIYRHLEY